MSENVRNVNKGFCHFPGLRHIPYPILIRQKMSETSTKDFVIFVFLDTFNIQFQYVRKCQKHQKRILSFSCFWTLSIFNFNMSENVRNINKGFCHFPVFRHFPYSNLICQKMSELSTKDFVISLV